MYDAVIEVHLNSKTGKYEICDFSQEMLQKIGFKIGGFCLPSGYEAIREDHRNLVKCAEFAYHNPETQVLACLHQTQITARDTLDNLNIKKVYDSCIALIQVIMIKDESYTFNDLVLKEFEELEKILDETKGIKPEEPKRCFDCGVDGGHHKRCPSQ